MQIYFGIVENRSDPLRLGRCQVRVVGLHTHDKNLLPTSDLPWCASLQPTTSAAMNGIGYSYVGPVEGTSVVVTYLDDSLQQGLIMGAVGGIATEPVPIDYDDSGPINTSGVKKTVELRSVPGPTTGNKLTFYDPVSSRTDITSQLTANMRVSGFGIDYGTTIVSIDSGTEITISSSVRDFGENLVEFTEPLSNSTAVVESKTNITASTLSQQADPIKTTPVNSEIPTLPPLPEFKNTQTKASEGIKALIAACDKIGLTTKEQKCALLGIVGGETGWIPQEENHNYSSEYRLKEVFSFLTDEEALKYKNATKNGISKAEFFSFMYGPTKRGKGFLGNKTDEDGGKYYGRGLIQLTGRANYEQFDKLAKQYDGTVDILENPDSLNSDINVSALIAALFIKTKTPKGININAHPDYFYAAKAKVGYNTANIAARKLKYYEYFYGAEGGGVVKDAGAADPGVNNDTDATNPGPSKASITTGSFGLGFRDPNNKYPLKDYIGESDMNRLSRGIIEGTIIKLKDAKRVFNVPKALDNGSWDQPLAPYGAKYPFNKVYESESGHIQEFDDTPSQERVHTYHRSGTFTEVDPNGTQVNYIVGDNFILMEANGCIHVAGECNITVDGNTNIYARSDANIQVDQNATLKVGNNLDIGVAQDVTMAVGGDYSVKVAGNYKIQASNISQKSDNDYNVQANTKVSLKSYETNIEAGSDMNILAGGTLNADYSEGQFGNGASGANDVDAVSLTPPSAGIPLNTSIPYSVPPIREFEDKAVIETPEDWDTPEGRSNANNIQKTEGVAITTPAIAEESGKPITGGSGKQVEVDKTQIQTTKDFTNDYRLSKNISLGMVIWGGVGGDHKLTPQMLKPNKDAQERLYTVQEIVGNLADTANNVLEKIVDVLPGGMSGRGSQWVITSGYRLKGVVANESPTSDHCKGHCVDIGLTLPDKYNKTYQLIQQIEPLIVYDQLILEYRYPDKVWMHIGFRRDNNRKQAFTMVNDKVFKRDSKNIPSGFYLITNIPPKGAA
jgi:predicted chitinase